MRQLYLFLYFKFWFSLFKLDMSTEESFDIVYKGKDVKVSIIQDGANLFFSVHLPTVITIAEHAIEDEWTWYDVQNGETPLAAELGELIEAADV